MFNVFALTNTIFLFSLHSHCGKTFFFFFTSQHLSKPLKFSLICALQKLCRKKLQTLLLLLVLSLERKSFFFFFSFFFPSFGFTLNFMFFFSSPNLEDLWDKALRLIHIPWVENEYTTLTSPSKNSLFFPHQRNP